MFGSYLLGYILPIIITVFLLFWMRRNCDTDYKFPRPADAIVLSICSLAPILNIAIAVIVAWYYIAGRLGGFIQLKKNKMNAKLFNIEKEEEN